MTTLFIAFKLLWKRRLANLTLLLQVLISISMLAQLFVYIVDHLDNIRAVNELPIKDTLVLNIFDYYTTDYAMQKIQTYPLVDSIGNVYMSNTYCNNVSCNLALYNDSIIVHYLPELQSGSWLLNYQSDGDSEMPAVISDDLGLKVGSTAEINLPEGKICRISVIGILKKPTQYLYPSGSASPKYFTAKSVISQDPVVIVRDTDFKNAFKNESIYELLSDSLLSRNIFLFMKSDTTDVDVKTAVKIWNKYGEITPMTSLVSTYNKNTNIMISGGIIMFVVFLSLAATSVLSNNVIQSLRNRKLFTVYYLLGMDWRKGAAVEIYRVAVLIIFMMMLCLIAGRFGFFMLEWMTPARVFLFYGIVFLYLLIMFIAVGAGFLVKLMHEDISGALKDLQQGE